MKKLLINGNVSEEAEKIIVDRNRGSIRGLAGASVVFEMGGVNFELLDFVVEGGEDAPEKTADEKVADLESDNAFLALQLADAQSKQQTAESDAAFIALQLADTQTRLDQTEAAQADLLFSLVEKGVL